MRMIQLGTWIGSIKHVSPDASMYCRLGLGGCDVPRKVEFGADAGWAAPTLSLTVKLGSPGSLFPGMTMCLARATSTNRSMRWIASGRSA